VETVSGLTRDILDRARRSRDARFDGRFFIAVRSTRIYCRPICPSRFSNDSNVRYYATAEEAAEAGYRPCLRCRPEAAPGSPAWAGTSAVVQRALRLIQDGALDRGTVGTLADRLGIGVRHLSRLFAQHVGASPATVALTRRLHFAKRLLDDTHLPITDIALASGFGSIRRFNDAFRATYRRSPRELRKGRGIAGEASEAAEITLRLAYRPPYDWDQLHAFLARGAIRGLEVVTGRGYARAAQTPSGHATLQIRPVEHSHALELRIRGALPAELPPLLSSVRRMFDLTADPARITTAMCSDTLLGPLIARRPGLRIPGAWDPFECSVRAIVGQQIGVAAEMAVLRRLVERFGEPIEPPLTEIRHVFPTAEVLADANLDELGLTGTRREALRHLARGVCDKVIRFDSPAEEVSRMLCALPGVGRWTAGYVVLRSLGEPDAFPFGDLLLRRRASTGEKPLTPLALEARAERWRPFRGYAVFHLWTDEQLRGITRRRATS
jgi:AraC family transcriptional regulator, regulatory protein of adaptative response / DNA-3-methyladenine glycosylase II